MEKWKKFMIPLELVILLTTRNSFVLFCEYIKRDDISIDIALDVLRISSIYYNRFSVQTEVEYNNTFKNVLMS